jgi:hypothetical protein
MLRSFTVMYIAVAIDIAMFEFPHVSLGLSPLITSLCSSQLWDSKWRH